VEINSHPSDLGGCFYFEVHDDQRAYQSTCKLTAHSRQTVGNIIAICLTRKWRHKRYQHNLPFALVVEIQKKH
jgi:hypothetical protein